MTALLPVVLLVGMWGHSIRYHTYAGHSSHECIVRLESCEGAFLFFWEEDADASRPVGFYARSYQFKKELIDTQHLVWTAKWRKSFPDGVLTMVAVPWWAIIAPFTFAAYIIWRKPKSQSCIAITFPVELAAASTPQPEVIQGPGDPFHA